MQQLLVATGGTAADADFFLACSSAVCVCVLPCEGGESDAGVRRPGDDVEEDDDQSDLRHLPLVLQPVEILHRVTSAAVTVDAAVDLPHGSETHRDLLSGPAAC